MKMFASVSISLLVLLTKSAAGQEGCVMTNTTCPCTVTAASGNCMRAQGNNTCLLGECTEGYKCDCFGFEQCTIKSCAIHTTDANAVPSAETPFRCHLTPDAGKCVVFDHFLDTLAAANNAKAESSASVKETDMEMMAASDDMMKVQGHKVVLAQIFEDLDTFAEQVTEDERKEVEQEAEIVVKAGAEIQAELVEMQKDVVEAFTANLQAGNFYRTARRKDASAMEKEEEEKVEAAKPEHKDKCPPCEAMKPGIKKLRKEAQEAATLAGTWTKKVQGAQGRARGLRKKANDIRLSAEEASARSVDRSQRILTRLRSS